ncbi:MAG: hypothetical protein ACPKNR_01320 [Pleomorphochaeta sp.]
MKKLLTILTISLIATAALFAKTAQVQLVTSVDETPVTYLLAYDGTTINDGADYSITVKPLTQNDQTKDFTVTASSNKNNDLAISVSVVADTFKTKLNGNKVYDSNIQPKVNTSVDVDTLTAGKHTNFLVNKFNLSWNGNADLPAGDYTSNVRIEYSIN